MSRRWATKKRSHCNLKDGLESLGSLWGKKTKTLLTKLDGLATQKGDFKKYPKIYCLCCFGSGISLPILVQNKTRQMSSLYSVLLGQARFHQRQLNIHEDGQQILIQKHLQLQTVI